MFLQSLCFLLFISLVRGEFVRGGSCPTVVPEGNWPSTAEDLYTKMASYGKLRLVIRFPYVEEIPTTCVTLTHTNGSAFYTLTDYERKSSLTTSGSFTAVVKPGNNIVLNMEVGHKVFGSLEEGGTGNLQYIYEDEFYVHARSCRPKGSNRHSEAIYIFLKENISYGAVELECLQKKIKARYGSQLRNWMATGVCE